MRSNFLTGTLALAAALALTGACGGDDSGGGSGGTSGSGGATGGTGGGATGGASGSGGAATGGSAGSGGTGTGGASGSGGSGGTGGSATGGAGGSGGGATGGAGGTGGGGNAQASKITASFTVTIDSDTYTLTECNNPGGGQTSPISRVTTNSQGKTFAGLECKSKDAFVAIKFEAKTGSWTALSKAKGDILLTITMSRTSPYKIVNVLEAPTFDFQVTEWDSTGPKISGSVNLTAGTTGQAGALKGSWSGVFADCRNNPAPSCGILP